MRLHTCIFTLSQPRLAAPAPLASRRRCALAAIVCAVRTLSPSTTAHITQERLFHHVTGGAATSRGLRSGISLSECESLLASLALPTSVRFRLQQADDPELFSAVFSADLQEISNGKKLLLVNVLRQLKGTWTGHWMVCAARAAVESGETWALALDPAAHKLGAHWLPDGLLLSAMCTRNTRNEARGYILIEAVESDAS